MAANKAFKCTCPEPKSAGNYSVMYYNKQGQPVYQSMCKVCNRKYQKRYYQRHKKEIMAQRKSAHKGAVKAKQAGKKKKT